MAAALTLSFYGMPSVSRLTSAPPLSYGAGLLIGFYGLSATVIFPRFGAASFIAFILVAQVALTGGLALAPGAIFRFFQV